MVPYLLFHVRGGFPPNFDSIKWIFLYRSLKIIFVEMIHFYLSGLPTVLRSLLLKIIILSVALL